MRGDGLRWSAGVTTIETTSRRKERDGEGRGKGGWGAHLAIDVSARSSQNSSRDSGVAGSAASSALASACATFSRTNLVEMMTWLVHKTEGSGITGSGILIRIWHLHHSGNQPPAPPSRARTHPADDGSAAIASIAARGVAPVCATRCVTRAKNSPPASADGSRCVNMDARAQCAASSSKVPFAWETARGEGEGGSVQW